MKLLLLATLLLLAACASELEWPVDELEAWNGKSEHWVTRQLGPPDEENVVPQPIPDIGHFQGIQRRLEKEYPGYHREVRRLGWKKKDENFLAFMVIRRNEWVILDAVKWKDGVEF